MPLPAPILDDRSYQQLRDELVRRIPVYTPEWTDHNESDPGITLIDLFAFLGENLLFRFNQVPEATKLAFLRLLDMPPRPAAPARSMVELTAPVIGGGATPVEQGTEVRAGSVPFETIDEVEVWPITLVGVARSTAAPPESAEARAFAGAAVDALGTLAPEERVGYYIAREIPIDPTAPGAPVLDFNDTVDSILWLAVLPAKDTTKAAVGPMLAGQIINIGFLNDEPVASMGDVTACPGARDEARPPEVLWEISTGKTDAGKPQYARLTPVGDSTRGLTRSGIIRLELPVDATSFGPFALPTPDLQGTRDFPPELRVAKQNEDVVFWIRAVRRDASMPIRRVVWVGANATEVEQRRTARTEFLGTGTGQPSQQMRLVNRPVLAESLQLEVEEPGGWKAWREVPNFDASVRDDRHYMLDLQAGVVRFGNCFRGRAPQIGERVRARKYSYGGGEQGNVPAKAISKVDRPASVKANNPVRARCGAPEESIEQALDRIPGEFRRHDRAVTEGDFKELTVMTPGEEVGRAECLPRFHPPTKNLRAAGVVTVVVWPREDQAHPNAPIPDRRLLREVCRWLDTRRLVTTELWVIPPTYRRIAVALGVSVKPGYGIEAVRRWVELVVRQYLAPLPPFGPDGNGWPLGRRVHGPEIEAAALQVEGVEFLVQRETSTGCGDSVAYFDDATQQWIPGTVILEPWEVPELTTITVVQGVPLEPGQELGPPPLPVVAVPVPTLREEC